MRWIVVLSSLIGGACLTPGVETQRGEVLDGVESDRREVVALYETQTLQTPTGPLEVLGPHGGGVMLCPTLALTVMHAVPDDKIYVTNERRIGTARDVMVFIPHLSEARKERIYLPYVEQVPAPVSQRLQAEVVDRLTLGQTRSGRGSLFPYTAFGPLRDDGLALVRLPAGLSQPERFPVLRYGVLRPGTPTTVVGYGRTWEQPSDAFIGGAGDDPAGRGVRRQRDAPWLGMATVPDQLQPLSRFGRSSGRGDSGSPRFVGETLTAVHIGTDGETDFGYDVSANLRWIVNGIRRWCPRSTATPPARELPAAPAAPTNLRIIAQSDDLAIGPEDTVCLCEESCEQSCGVIAPAPPGECSCGADGWCERRSLDAGGTLCECDPDCRAGD